MSAAVPESELTSDQLLKLSNFRRELADALDIALGGAGSVELADIATIATARVLGRVTAGTGVIEAMTGTQATTLLDSFTSALKGLAPASGGGTASYLRADGTWTQPSGTTYNVKTSPYNAVGNDTADDRLAIQAAIDACSAAGGGDVYIPNGTYRLTQGAGFYCLTLPGNVRLRGESRTGAILKQAASIADSVRLVYITGNDAGLTTLTLDGNKANNTTQEQRHGFFAETTQRLRIDRVTSQNFTGDGFYLYTAAHNSILIDCYALGNERNGITLGGAGTDGCLILGGQWIGNAYQQIDSEPGGIVSNVSIVGALIDAGGASTDYVLTCSGFSRTVRGTGWYVAGCTINGPVFAVWCDNLTFVGNKGISTNADKPHISVYRKCVGVILSGNHFRSTANVGSDKMVVHIFGTDDVNGDRPSGVVIHGNTVTQNVSEGNGIYVSGAEDVTVGDNYVVGAGTNTPGYYGIYIRTTLASWPTRSARVSRNHVKNFGSAAVACAGSGAATTLSVDISGNTFDSDVASVQPIGISFNIDGSNAVQKATAIGNNCTGFTTTEISDYPVSTVPVLIGGNQGERGIYSVTGTPEGALTEAVGAIAIRRDGSAGLVTYYKNSGSGNTGWVPAGGVVAGGTITCTTKANYADTDYMTIGDGIQIAKLYEFDTAGDGVTAGRIQVNISGATSASDVAVILKAAIDANQPSITVAEATGVLTLTHKIAGTFANVTITENVTNAAHTVAGMTGGINPGR